MSLLDNYRNRYVVSLPLFTMMILLLVTCGGEDTPATSDAAVGPVNRNLIFACLRTTACDVQMYPAVFNCLDTYNDLISGSSIDAVYGDMIICANRAQSCAQIQECFGQQGSCDRKYQASCAGGKATFCDLTDKKIYAYDCASVGYQCEVDSQFSFSATCRGSSSSFVNLDQDLSCTGGLCQKTEQACSSGSELNRCSGQLLSACLEGKWVDFDCARLGLGPCQEEDLGWARCSAPK